MSESRFVVEVVGQPKEARDVTIVRVRDALGLDESRAAALVARMPGVITRPADEMRAMRVALRLQAAGVAALHRPWDDVEEATAPGADAGAAPPEVVPEVTVQAPDASEVVPEAPGVEAEVPAVASEAFEVVAEVPEHVAEATAETTELAPADVVDADAEPYGMKIDAEAPVEADGLEAAETTWDADGLDAAEPTWDADALDATQEIDAPGSELGDVAAALDLDAPAADALGPDAAPSLDATPPPDAFDPKLTPMTEAGFGAADIVLPTDGVGAAPEARQDDGGADGDVGPDPLGGDERPLTPVPEAFAAPAATGARWTPTPVPEHPAPPAGRGTPVPERAGGSGHGEAGRGGRSARREEGARPGDPVYRQTRSSAEPPLTLSAPSEAALRRSGVPEPEIAAASGRRRGRLGRALAARVALPVLLSWALGAVGTWLLLPLESRLELFVPIASATAIATLVAAWLAGSATLGIARDVVRLRDEARRVAMGELTTPVTTRRDDELGEIAGSLERMRLSLQEGLERLRKRRRG